MDLSPFRPPLEPWAGDFSSGRLQLAKQKGRDDAALWLNERGEAGNLDPSHSRIFAGARSGRELAFIPTKREGKLTEKFLAAIRVSPRNVEVTS
jgi:hypothetical protein